MNENEQQPQLVTNLIEAAQYLVNQYNNVISKTDRDDVQGVIEQLQVFGQILPRIDAAKGGVVNEEVLRVGGVWAPPLEHQSEDLACLPRQR